MWMFAALNTIEPPIGEREQVAFEEGSVRWSAQRIPVLEDRIHARLEELACWLGEALWLEGSFSAGDLMMVMGLRRLEGMAILERHPTLAAYVAGAEARPAYRRAFAAQLDVFKRGNHRMIRHMSEQRRAFAGPGTASFKVAAYRIRELLEPAA